MNINQQLAEELGLQQNYVDNVIQLIDEGNTIPFIARYRKELHGAMDDTTLRTLAERLEYLRNLDERRETIINSISEQGKLTDELAAAISEATTLAALEDLYRPYKQKRRTRATVAKEKGLLRRMPIVPPRKTPPRIILTMKKVFSPWKRHCRELPIL